MSESSKNQPEPRGAVDLAARAKQKAEQKAAEVIEAHEPQALDVADQAVRALEEVLRRNNMSPVGVIFVAAVRPLEDDGFTYVLSTAPQREKMDPADAMAMAHAAHQIAVTLVRGEGEPPIQH